MDRDQDFNMGPLAAPPATLPPPPPEAQHSLFIGRFGLRAGWGLLLYAVLFFLLGAIFSSGAKTTHGHLKDSIHNMMESHHTRAAGVKAPPKAAPAPTPSRNMEVKPRAAAIGESLGFLALLLAAWILSRIERRRLAVYGIGAHRIRDILPGAFWGLACLSVLVGALWAGHFLVFDYRRLTGALIFFYGAKWLLVFFCVGLFEEYLFRGYLQYTLLRGVYGLAERFSSIHARAVAFWLAAILLSLLFLFAHGHNPGEDRTGLLSVFLAGLVFAYALWRTGSLWWAIGFHMAWDWAQSFLYGVPDSGGLSLGRLFQTHPTGNPLLSGGTVGPEGSVLLIPTVVLIALVIRFTTKPGFQPALEPQTPLLDELNETNSIIA